MSQTGPWNYKGMDQRAREAAREAAMAEGISLTEYISRMLHAADDYEPEEVRPPYPGASYGPSYNQPNYRGAPRMPQTDPHRSQDAASALDRLSRRIEASEARSTLAITGIDHTVLGLVARIENSEQTTAAVAGHVEGLIEEMRATHEALQSKVRRMEQDDAGKHNIEALKALESALGKLANHVYEEAELAQNETQAIKGRVEAGFTDITDRVEGMETRVERKLSDAAARVERAVEEAEQRRQDDARQMTERLDKLENDFSEGLPGKVEDRLSAVEDDVSGALSSMEATLLRVQERLNRAETTTDAALKGLESTFASLDERIDAVARTVDPELAGRLRQEFDARFEDITQLVRSTVDNARQELASEIARTAEQDSETEAQLRSEIGELKTRLAEVEARDPEELTAGVREEIDRLGTTISERMDTLAEHVETRIEESELRSADAIEQVGEQVTVAAVRLQKRQDEALSALAAEIETGRQQTDVRLSDALASVSERLEDIQNQAETSISPVQRAIAALASRLESLEAFSAPPGTPLPPPISLDSEPYQAEPDFYYETEDAPPPLPPAELAAEADEATLAPDASEVEADGEESLFDETEAASGLNFEDLMATPDEETREAGLATDTGADSAPVKDARSGPGDVSGASDPFESGLESWEETAEDTEAPFEAGIESDADAAPEASAADSEDEETPYGSDFEAIRAAVERLSTVRDEANAASSSTVEESEDEAEDFLAGLADEDEASDNAFDEDDDPLAELAGLEDARSETRESDIFDDEEEARDPLPFVEISVATADEDTSGLIETLDSAAADEDASTSDYIARARRAAMAAAEAQSRPRRSVNAPLLQKPRGIGKTPLYLAASAVMLTGAGAGGYLYLRGKQAPEPTLSGPIDTYVDPELAAAPPLDPAVEIEQSAALPAFPDLAEMGGPAAEEADLFEDADMALIEAEMFAEAADEFGGAPPAPAAKPETLAALAPAQAASYPAIPAIVTVESEANAGNAIAQYQLAQSLRTGGDLDAAVPLLRRAALKGIAPAQYDLGKLYEHGYGVDRDLIQARSLIASAAEAGHIGAMYDLALFMAEGEGGPADEQGAIEWFRKAADHGFTDAQYNLGVMYAEGIGTEVDLTEALFWFELAARDGDTAAALEVRNLSARLPEALARDAQALAGEWEALPPVALANGRFGAQRWNTGNPLQVQAVQTALSRLGYLGGEPDGVLGPQTAEAIRAYQRSQGLPVTGSVTPELIERLNTGAARGRG